LSLKTVIVHIKIAVHLKIVHACHNSPLLCKMRLCSPVKLLHMSKIAHCQSKIASVHHELLLVSKIVTVD